MKSLIVIPARYASTRFPGKPLQKIAGKTMLQRVCEIAQFAGREVNAEVLVATDDECIFKHARDLNVNVVMTAGDCRTGTDRVLDAISQLSAQPDFVVNFQGDAPLTPPHFISALIQEAETDEDVRVVTPAVHLTWKALDQLRKNKLTTPFSGTTVVLKSNKDALWFSKNIIPAIRKEEKLRHEKDFSPVYRQIGLYGYRLELLKKYVTLTEGYYEKLEGLEQLRLLENNYPIRVVVVDYQGKPSMSGIDTPEDIKRAELLIAQYGEVI